MIDYDSPYVNNTDSYIVNHEGTLMFVSDEADDDEKGIIVASSIKCTKINDSQISDDNLDRFEYLDTKSDITKMTIITTLLMMNFLVWHN
jgi:hypothetical protein